MEKLSKLINHKASLVVIVLFAWLCFAFSFLSSRGIMPNESFIPISWVKDSLYGILVLLILVISKDTFTAVFTIMLYPFTISTQFDVGNFPISIVLPIIGTVLGIIINIVRFKPTFKLGKYTIGIGIYAVGLALGGLFSKAYGDYTEVMFRWWHPFVILIATGGIVFALSFISSTNERGFDDIADLMLNLALLIILEVFLFVVTLDTSIVDYFYTKSMNLGWGVTNNIALILLACIPFALYRPLKDLKKNWGYLVYYVFICAAIVFTISKGGILAVIIGSIVAYLVFMFRSKNKLPYIILLVVMIAGALTAYLILYFGMRDVYDAIMSHINLGSTRARFVIYKSALDIYANNPVFGIGLFGGLGWKLLFPYTFAHNTILQMMLTSGTFGLICLIYHLVDKYTRVLYKPTTKKLIMFLSFLFPALYGLIDVSYLYAPYMVVLFIEMSLFNKEIEDEKIKYLF